MRSGIFALLLSITLLKGMGVSKSIAQTSFNPAEITKKASASVVLIRGVTSSQESQLGTGFLISSDGQIATALHVIKDFKSGGTQLASGKVAFDQRKDLAIIKVAGFDLPPIELGNSNQVSAGEQVLLIGSPQGLQGSVTTGVVSAIRDLERFKIIQTDAAANPGNSGGPLLNANGQAIGVLDSKLRGSESLSFALPISYVRGMLGELKTAMTLGDLKENLGPGVDVFKASTPQTFPTRWKSLLSGTSCILRFEEDHIYTELIMSDQAKSMGLFTLCDYLRKGGKYEGTCRNRTVLNSWDSNYKKFCTGTFLSEFSLVSPSRIEGRSIGARKGTEKEFDYGKCEPKHKKWLSFVWIPEQ